MDQKYQELVTNQQNLMAADTPSRPASLTHQPSESKMPLQYHPVAVQSTVEFVMYIYIDVCVCKCDEHLLQGHEGPAGQSVCAMYSARRSDEQFALSCQDSF